MTKTRIDFATQLRLSAFVREPENVHTPDAQLAEQAAKALNYPFAARHVKAVRLALGQDSVPMPTRDELLAERDELLARIDRLSNELEQHATLLGEQRARIDELQGRLSGYTTAAAVTKQAA